MNNQPATSHTATLQQHYQALEDAHADLSLRLQQGVLGGDITEAREQISKLREIATTFQETLEGSATLLSDGRSLLTFEYEALQSFSDHNKINFDKVLARASIKGGRVRKANFSWLGLSTLEGLGALSQLGSLDVGSNQKLTTLTGVNTQAIEKIYAGTCGLSELSVLQSASKLKVLDVIGNQALTSLDGVNPQVLEEVLAEDCSLSDLSALHSASRLRVLDVRWNPILQASSAQQEIIAALIERGVHVLEGS